MEGADLGCVLEGGRQREKLGRHRARLGVPCRLLLGRRFLGRRVESLATYLCGILVGFPPADALGTTGLVPWPASVVHGLHEFDAGLGTVGELYDAGEIAFEADTELTVVCVLTAMAVHGGIASLEEVDGAGMVGIGVGRFVSPALFDVVAAGIPAGGAMVCGAGEATHVSAR